MIVKQERASKCYFRAHLVDAMVTLLSDTATGARSEHTNVLHLTNLMHFSLSPGHSRLCRSPWCLIDVNPKGRVIRWRHSPGSCEETQLQ